MDAGTRDRWYNTIRKKAKRYDSLDAAIADAPNILPQSNEYPRMIVLYRANTAAYDWFCNVFRYPDGRIGHTTPTYFPASA